VFLWDWEPLKPGQRDSSFFPLQNCKVPKGLPTVKKNPKAHCKNTVRTLIHSLNDLTPVISEITEETSPWRKRGA